VAQIIPELQDPNRWEEIVYNRQDRDDDILQRTGHGKVLFKYDPNHSGKKRAMLWAEQGSTPGERYLDEWN
jgi:hypothetical protein